MICGHARSVDRSLILSIISLRSVAAQFDVSSSVSGGWEPGIISAPSSVQAHELNLSCLAEGVETNRQLQELLALGCDSFQGFLLGKPMPAVSLEELIRGETTTSPNGA